MPQRDNVVYLKTKRKINNDLQCLTLHTLRLSSYVFSPSRISPLFFFGCHAVTQLALQLHQEHTQVGCSNREARKRPARGHFHNGPWTCRHTHTHIHKQERNTTKLKFSTCNMDGDTQNLNFAQFKCFLLTANCR